MKIKHEPFIFAVMRFFAFIMAVIVLALSAMPCMDEGCGINSGKTNAQISTSHNSTGHSDSDPCSPFCTCNCCSGVTILFSSILIQHQVFEPAKFYSAYLSTNISQVSLPVWQPPQLS